MEAALKALKDQRKSLKSKITRTANSLKQAVSDKSLAEAKSLHETLLNLFRVQYINLHYDYVEALEDTAESSVNVEPYKLVNGMSCDQHLEAVQQVFSEASNAFNEFSKSCEHSELSTAVELPLLLAMQTIEELKDFLCNEKSVLSSDNILSKADHCMDGLRSHYDQCRITSSGNDLCVDILNKLSGTILELSQNITKVTGLAESKQAASHRQGSVFSSANDQSSSSPHSSHTHSTPSGPQSQTHGTLTRSELQTQTGDVYHSNDTTRSNNSSRYKRPKPPKFSGTRREWPEFKAVWQIHASAYYDNDLERSHALKECLSGNPMYHVRPIYSSNPGAYGDIWGRLLEIYDDVSLSVQSVFSDLKRLKPVKDGDPNGLVRLVNDIEMGYSQLKQIGNLECVTMIQVDEVCECLPSTIRDLWEEKYHALSNSEKLHPFKAFMDFLSLKRSVSLRRAEKPQSKCKSEPQGNSQSDYKSTKVRTFHTSTEFSKKKAERPDIECDFHSSEGSECKHSTQPCTDLRKLSLEDQLESIISQPCLSKSHFSNHGPLFETTVRNRESEDFVYLCEPYAVSASVFESSSQVQSHRKIWPVVTDICLEFHQAIVEQSCVTRYMPVNLAVDLFETRCNQVDSAFTRKPTVCNIQVADEPKLDSVFSQVGKISALCNSYALSVEIAYSVGNPLSCVSIDNAHSFTHSIFCSKSWVVNVPSTVISCDSLPSVSHDRYYLPHPQLSPTVEKSHVYQVFIESSVYCSFRSGLSDAKLFTLTNARSTVFDPGLLAIIIVYVYILLSYAVCYNASEIVRKIIPGLKKVTNVAASKAHIPLEEYSQFCSSRRVYWAVARGLAVCRAKSFREGLIAPSREAWKSMVKTSVYKLSSESGTKWIFGPANSPWYQEAIESMIKNIKLAIKYAMGNQRLKYSEFETVCQLAANQVNERPLGTLSSSDSDVSVLTPNSLLLGRAFSVNPGIGVASESLNKQRSVVTTVGNEFWKRWCQFYVPTMFSKSKNIRNTRNLMVGDVVVVTETNPLKQGYFIARVHSVYPSRDGIVRKVSLAYKNTRIGSKVHEYRGSPDTVITRSVKNLALLVPVE